MWRVGLGLWLVGCSPPSTTQAEGKVAPRAVAPDPEPECRPSPGGGAWARFTGAECDWELRDEGERLILSSLAIDAPAPMRGEVPEPCRTRTCVYHGVWTSVGPLLLAVVPSPQSEMPSDVLLGVAHGDRLAFTSLWDGAGEPVESDLTPVGPAHALAPFVCGDALALLAVERLDMVGLPPPASLRAREGRLDPAGLVAGSAAGGSPQPAAPVERESCRQVDLPVP
jgi:hypothetical protein